MRRVTDKQLDKLYTQTHNTVSFFCNDLNAHYITGNIYVHNIARLTIENELDVKIFTGSVHNNQAIVQKLKSRTIQYD